MVVDHCQGCSRPPPNGDISLEVHLPQRVGLGVLEPLPGLLAGRHHRLTVAAQDLGDGRCDMAATGLAGAGCARDLAAAPHRVLRRTASTASSVSASVRDGDRCGRRDRSVSPAGPSATVALQPPVQRLRGWILNHRQSWRRLAPSHSANRQTSSRGFFLPENGIENLMDPLLRGVHHVSEHLFTYLPVRTMGRRGKAPEMIPKSMILNLQALLLGPLGLSPSGPLEPPPPQDGRGE